MWSQTIQCKFWLRVSTSEILTFSRSSGWLASLFHITRQLILSSGFSTRRRRRNMSDRPRHGNVCSNSRNNLWFQGCRLIAESSSSFSCPLVKNRWTQMSLDLATVSQLHTESTQSTSSVMLSVHFVGGLPICRTPSTEASNTFFTSRSSCKQQIWPKAVVFFVE